MTLHAVDAGRAFVERDFPECLAAFLAGSVIRGDATKTSDLDIVIITERKEAPYRESLRAFGWPIEVFVHTIDSLREYFAGDVKRRRPALVVMCLESVVLRDRDGLAQRIKDEARELLERGPEPLTPEEMDLRRYGLTDLLDDFLGCDRFDEGMFIANDLATDAHELILSSHRRWLGQGKWIPRALKNFDPELARQLTEALEAYYRREEKDALVMFVDAALDLVGGRLFEGYYSAGKPIEPKPEILA